MPLIDFSTYKTRKELESFATSLYTQVAILQSKLAELELKTQVASTPTEIANSITLEEQLLLREIKYIDETSRMGGLDLEQTKQLNLLISCLVSIRKGDKEDTKNGKKPIGKLEKAKLLELVREQSN
jgi:hypothetical protein